MDTLVGDPKSVKSIRNPFSLILTALMMETMAKMTLLT